VERFVELGQRVAGQIQAAVFPRDRRMEDDAVSSEFGVVMATHDNVTPQTSTHLLSVALSCLSMPNARAVALAFAAEAEASPCRLQSSDTAAGLPAHRKANEVEFEWSRVQLRC
jgi:hypothetical protein